MNKLHKLALKLGIPYSEGDQDLYLMGASADRCLEFASRIPSLVLDDFEQGEAFGLLLASYQLHLDESPPSPNLESQIAQIFQSWRGNTWVLAMVKSEGWDSQGILGPLLGRLREH